MVEHNEPPAVDAAPAPWVEVTGPVLLNRQVADDVYRMQISAPAVCARARPGQFVMVVAWPGEPLLPRAMAPIRFGGDGVLDIYYRVVGAGTKAMAAYPVGRPAVVIGPLGQALPIPTGPLALLGRGVGITPLLPIAEAAKRQGTAVRSYLSARQPELLLEADAFAACGRLVTHTDQQAPEALVTDALARDLAAGWRPSLALVAGAHRLTRAVGALAARYRFPAYVFVEEKMACGVGYCKGCAIGRRRALICLEGPALPLEEVLG